MSELPAVIIGDERSVDWLLPQVIRDVAQVIGRRQAFLLAGAVCPPFVGGGKGKRGRSGSIYVPADLGRAHGKRLIAAIGRQDAKRLSAAFGGIILHFPSCDAFLRYHRNAAIRRMVADGWTITATAWAFGVCSRTAANIAVEERAARRASKSPLSP